MADNLETRPYQGRWVALGTKHGKEQQIAQPLWATVGLHVVVPDGLDTDTLGTFTGEIPRPGAPEEVVLQKARLAMLAAGIPLGLANEGSFGPHPSLPFILADTEILAFIDDERGIHLLETLVSEKTNAVQCTVRPSENIDDFLRRAQFPSHGLIVRPNKLSSAELIFKGITDYARLQNTIKRCIDASPDGLAYIETDMRAHMNPTRQMVIRQLAIRLGNRLACPCPSCGMVGWGRVDVIRGLPCEWCGTPTDLIKEEVFGCLVCPERKYFPRTDGKQYAPAEQCQSCNP